MKHNPGKIFSILLAILILGQLFFMDLNTAIAAPVYDQNTGTYTDDFSDATGIPTKSHVSANPTPDYLQLLNNPNNTYVAPFWTSGYVVTSAIVPTSVAKWGSVSFNADVPAGTTIKVQVCDRDCNIFTDNALSGNTAGFTTSPIDISALSPLIVSLNTASAKIGVIKIKITMTTNDTNITPTFDDLSVSWTPKQGDLTATTADSTNWNAMFGNQQGTMHKNVSNPSTYSAVRWATDRNTDFNVTNTLFTRNDQLITTLPWNENFEKNVVQSLDRDTGETQWTLPADMYGYFSIGQNGTGYQVDHAEDFFSAIDMNTGQTKWTYNWGGGHGNQVTTIGPDGTIYAIVQPNIICNGGFCVSKTMVLYAFNPDGTIAWTSNIVSEDYIYGNGLALSPTGQLILSTSTMTDMGVSTNNGVVYAINLTTHLVDWQYSTGDTISVTLPVVGSDGTVYIGGNFYQSSQKNIYAINSDGTLKWSKNYLDAADYGYMHYSLRADGVLLAHAIKLWDENWEFYTSEIQAIDIDDGTLLWRKTLNQSGLSFSDGQNNFYLSALEDGSTNENFIATTGYYDSSGTNKWKLVYPYTNDPDAFITHYNFQDGVSSKSSLIGDDRGWQYGSFSMYKYDQDYNFLDRSTQQFALAPWTLSVSGLSGNVDPGSTLTLTATSAMQQTNPLFGGANQVQAVMENGDKVALSYSSTDVNGDTVWTGTYTIPTDIAAGEHTFTIEASQSYMQTDVTTHFASATTESGNTGITTTGTFRVLGVSTVLPETGSEYSYMKKISSMFLFDKFFAAYINENTL